MPDSRFSVLEAPGERKNPESVPQTGEISQDESVDVLLEELVEVLGAELDQYRDLLSLLHAQREFFAAGDVFSFEETSKKQGTVVLKVKTLEEARKSIVSRLARYFGIPDEGFTLARLAALVDGHYRERCLEYQREILSLIRKLDNPGENNAYLIQQALHYVSGVLRIFASAHTTEAAYSSDGRLDHETTKGKYV